MIIHGASYFGLQVVCSDTGNCNSQGTEANAEVVSTGPISVNVEENQAPSLGPSGLGNLFDQTSGYVWNFAADPWPATTVASDPSGVCNTAVLVNGTPVSEVASQSNQTTWQQCPSPATDAAVVDTDTSVPTSGQLTLSDQATNAAAVVSSASATIKVDNVQPTVNITPLNDANPGGWAVNHSVTLQIAPSVGPSGISALSCSDTLAGVTSTLALTPDPSVTGDDDVTIDGNGAHTVSCTVANNAIDPQGANNTGSASKTVEIDEQPPSISFEPTDPTNPAQVMVDVADSESVVAAGTLAIAPSGSSSYTPLPTTFAANSSGGGQLIATIPDGTLKAGAYTVEANANSQVGNAASSTEAVTLPLRSRTSEAISFKKLAGKLIVKTVRVRERVGFHYVTRVEHGKKVKVKVGGHYKTIKILKRLEQCTTKRVRVAKHKWKLRTICHKPHVSYLKKVKLGHGKSTKVYGELTTSQGAPIANAPVQVLQVAQTGARHARVVATVMTSATGGWSAKIPAGPSRLIEGHYSGANALLPQTARGQVIVAARIKLLITPTRLPYGSVMRISGRLLGGYVPIHGVAMRVLVKIPGLAKPYASTAFRTSRKGTFSFKYVAPTVFHSPHLTPIAVGMVGPENGYPFTATRSGYVNVDLGVRTPKRVKQRR
jgi:hypothetical protein